ncbi:MarR family winged helix-turn-helix transcriptional regulator [uncultured Marinobacter sp.]|uniref:MarR family winged helix-turn-helix transcriptional regulator n=1 Tax=uncultured Marinobacter sp. TaxID=187379 RepID=UPI0030D976A5
MTAPGNTSPRGCTNYKIRKLMRQVSQYYDTEIGRAGLKATQFALLGQLARLGPIRPGDLAQTMGMDASTLTRNLKPLTDAGLARTEQGTDARSRSVTITDAGHQKWAEAREYWKVAQGHINNVLGADRVIALHKLLDESLELLAHPTDEVTSP